VILFLRDDLPLCDTMDPVMSYTRPSLPKAMLQESGKSVRDPALKSPSAKYPSTISCAADGPSCLAPHRGLRYSLHHQLFIGHPPRDCARYRAQLEENFTTYPPNWRRDTGAFLLIKLASLSNDFAPGNIPRNETLISGHGILIPWLASSRLH
jgi:hypothetical protein